MSKLLIVVDFQNDFVVGSLGFKKAESLEDSIADKIKSYRDNDDQVVFTFDTHSDDYLKTLEGKYLPVPHCFIDSEGWQLYGKVKDLKQADDLTFIKGTFGSCDLFDYLRTHSFEQIELVGLVSNICVLTNAVLAKTASPETEIIVDASCTASFDDSLNDKTLDVLEGLQIIVKR